MLQVIQTQKHPEFGMLPAKAPTNYPFENGSFKPYCHFRLAIQENKGFFVKATAYENFDTIVKDTPKPENVFETCTMVFSLAKVGEYSVQIYGIYDIYGGVCFQLVSPEGVTDITADITSDFSPLFERGFSEVGYSWTTTSMISKEKLAKYLKMDHFSQLAGNCCIYSENTNYAHLGSINEFSDFSNRSIYRCDDLQPVQIVEL